MCGYATATPLTASRFMHTPPRKDTEHLMSRLLHTLVGTLAVTALSVGTATAVAPAASSAAAASASSASSAVVFEQGDRGRGVRIVQARLRQLGWYDGDVSGSFDDQTRTAVRKFQKQQGLPVDGVVDRPTLRTLEGLTHRPTHAEMTNQPPPPDDLDRRCLTGRVMCVDKTTSSLRWVVDGRVKVTLAARFGGPSTPTREGAFKVYRKSRDHVSSIYHTPMPYAMFFSGGQAVHYSPDFAAHGYSGASHGCVNIRAKRAIARLFNIVRIGTPVIVYRS